MAKYEQYAEYKDSGVEWLGKIPSHWDIIKGGYIGELFGSEAVLESHVVNEGDLPFIKVSTLSTDSFNIDSPEWFLSRKVDRFVRTQEDYIVFPKRGGAIFTNKVNIVSIPSVIDPNLMGWRINEKAISKYIALLLKTRRLDDIADVSTVPQINNKHINPQKFPLPPIEEQKLILNFLDHETAQIDTLIEKQQTLIQLLKEKRQAVISHAVTKGLNPDTPMKDSGVEWLGEVPEHWEVGRLKNVLRIRNGRDYKEVEIESGGYPVYGSGGVFKRSSDYLFDGESVLFGRKGTVDKPLLVSGKFWTVDTMFYSEVFSKAKPNYIYHQALLFPFDQLSTNTALPSMTQENLLELGFVIPPFDEQEQICQYLSNKLKVFSNLVSKAEQAIQLMQERRTALISAAVTGKIDVRGWESKVSDSTY